MKKTVNQSWSRQCATFSSWLRRMTLILFVMAVSGATALAAPKAKITLHLDNVALSKAIEQVEQQSDYKFSYTSADVEPYKVTCKIVDKPVEEALKEMLRGTSLKYDVSGQFVTIYSPKRREAAKAARRVTVTGAVMDSEHQMLAGVAVIPAGAESGVVTDNDGEFSITVPAGTELVFTYVGMHPQRIKAEKSGSIDVMLEDNASILDNVVVTGYQTLSKERATGAFDIISGKEIANRHVTNFSQALDGLVAGMQGSDDGRGGVAYQIRGLSTMVADRAPLIVLDGFPLMDVSSNEYGFRNNDGLGALEKINPNDVESITVLKDAAAASIWGARSANGVIVITTKRGAKKSHWDVDVNTQISVSKKYDVDQIMNPASSKDVIEFQRMAYQNGWVDDWSMYNGSLSDLTTAVSFSDLLFIKGLKWGSMSEADMNAQLAELAKLDNRKQIKDNLLRTPFTYKGNVSISGGTDFYQTYVSVMYQHDAGGFIGSKSNEVIVNWNNTFNVARWLEVTANVNFQNDKSKSSQIGYSNLASLSPYEMLLNPDGSYASNVGSYNTDVLGMYDWTQYTYQDVNYNMLQEARERNRTINNTGWRGQFGLKFKILDGLNFTTQLQYENNRFDNKAYSSERSFSSRFNVNYYTPADYNGVALGQPSAIPVGGVLSVNEGRSEGLVWRNNLNFDRTLNGVHSISVVAGQELSNYNSHYWTNPTLYGCSSPDGANGQVGKDGNVGTITGSTSNIPGVPTNGKRYLVETKNFNRYVSFYANASYTFDNRYGVSASVRTDASNLVTDDPKYRWSPLWSVGALWNIANERFMQGNHSVNRLTLRATYGKNGNACSTSSSRTTISSSSWTDPFTGLHFGEISDYGNPTLRWEKTKTYNFGLDFSLFNNNLFGSVDYYNKESVDVLGNVTMPAANGTTTAVFNNAAMLNKGVELTVGTQVEIGDLMLGATVNYSYNKNRITSLRHEMDVAQDFLNASYVEGYPMGSLFAFEYTGIGEDGLPSISDGKGGNYSFGDMEMTPFITTDFSHIKYKGTSIAPHTLGVSLSAMWRGFSLGAMFNGRFGGKMRLPEFTFPTVGGSKIEFNSTLGEVMAGSPGQLPLPGADVDPFYYSIWGFYRGTTDVAIADAGYVYCKEVILDYSFPRITSRTKGIHGLSVFGKLENLGLVWTANSKGWHPEYLPGTLSPTLTFTVGATATF